MPKTAIDRFEQRKLTRAKLVEAALQLFSTSGYEHATVDDISQAAGYSKGAYYFHFSTKDDILLELMRIWTEDRNGVLAAGLGMESHTREEMRDGLAGFFSYAEQPQWYATLLEFWAQAVRNPEVSSRLNQAYAGWRKQLTDAFAASDLSVESPADAAAVALAAHDGYAVQMAIGSPGGRAMTPGELAESLLAPLQVAAGTRQRRSAAR
ncbi:MAG TPA: TetR/AcrR family transcriptional regulator [Dehalococcoidia bacterium]|nr:TetR/AcrR family transcriptional regulator [Dehalococcoidia bacterium]